MLLLRLLSQTKKLSREFMQDVICLPCRALQLIADALIVILCCPCR